MRLPFFCLASILVIATAQSTFGQSASPESTSASPESSYAAPFAGCNPVTLACELGRYDPSQFNPDLSVRAAYVEPDLTNCAPLNAMKAPTLTAAFNAAPPKVQQEICKLRKIIVQTNPPTPVAWGFWENPVTKPTRHDPNSYVILSNPDFTTTLLNHETSNNNIVLRKVPSLQFTVTSWPGDNASFGLLAVIAHEIGHIIWHRDNIYDPYSTLPCYYETFISNASGTKSWQPGRELKETVARHWHPPPSVDSAAGTALHDNAVPHPIRFPPVNAGEISSILTNGFVTPFASISPEEDFVETYKFLALVTQNPGLRLTLHVTRPGNANLSVVPFSDSTAAKRTCVAKLM